MLVKGATEVSMMVADGYVDSAVMSVQKYIDSTHPRRYMFTINFQC